jgi:hypothetical protein
MVRKEQSSRTRRADFGSPAAAFKFHRPPLNRQKRRTLSRERVRRHLILTCTGSAMTPPIHAGLRPEALPAVFSANLTSFCVRNQEYSPNRNSFGSSGSLRVYGLRKAVVTGSSDYPTLAKLDPYLQAQEDCRYEIGVCESRAAHSHKRPHELSLGDGENLVCFWAMGIQ